MTTKRMEEESNLLTNREEIKNSVNPIIQEENKNKKEGLIYTEKKREKR